MNSPSGNNVQTVQRPYETTRACARTHIYLPALGVAIEPAPGLSRVAGVARDAALDLDVATVGVIVATVAQFVALNDLVAAERVVRLAETLHLAVLLVDDGVDDERHVTDAARRELVVVVLVAARRARVHYVVPARVRRRVGERRALKAVVVLKTAIC